MRPLSIISFLTSIALHGIIVAGLLIGFFYHKTPSYEVPGQLKIIHAYMVTEHQKLMHPRKLLKNTQRKSLSLNTSKQGTILQRTTSKLTIAQKKNPKRTSQTLKQHTSHKKSPLEQSKAISGKQLNQLIILIYKAIDAHKIYPEAARELHQTGKVLIAFSLLPSGQIEHVELIKTSGFKRLDNAAIASLKNTAKIDGVSRYLKHQQSFTIPIIFSMKS